MMKITQQTLLRLCLATSLLAALAACGNGASGFPPVNSPPPFDYADGAALRSGMHQLAYASQRLDSALLMQDTSDEATRLAVVDSLTDIQRIAGELERGDLNSTHNFLRSDMQNFQSAVSRAIRDAQANPPNFSSAGRVSGSCVNCHRTVQ